MDNKWDIRDVILKYPDIHERIRIYEQRLTSFSSEEKDSFLTQVLYIEQNRFIARFAYSHAEQYGEAHYHAITFLLENLFLKGSPKPKILPPFLVFNHNNEIVIQFPGQLLPQSFANKPLALQVNGLENETNQIELESGQQNEHVLTENFSSKLAWIEEDYQVQFLVSEEVFESWSIENISNQRPFFPFREKNRFQILSETLPRKQTWILTKGTIETEGIIEYGTLKRSWASFNYYLIDPSVKLDFFITFQDGSTCRLPFEEPERSIELMGSPLEDSFLDSITPWFTIVPKLSIPYENFEQISSSTVVQVSQKMGRDLLPVKKFILDKKRDFIEKEVENRRIIIDLADKEILGSSPVGEFIISVTGYERELRWINVPSLDVRFIPSVICPDANQGENIHLAIEGPDTILCNSSKWITVRQGLYRISRKSLKKTADSSINFSLYYNGQNAEFPLDITLRLPYISCSFDTFFLTKKIQPTSIGNMLLKSSLLELIDTVKIDIKKSADLCGYWRIQIGDQFGERIDGAEKDHLSIPLKIFSDTLQARYSDPIFFGLEYVNQGESTILHLLSLMDWTIQTFETKIDENDNCFHIALLWQESGREKPVFLQIHEETSLHPVCGAVITPNSIPASGYNVQKFHAEITVPFTIPKGNYILGFSYENEAGDWGIHPRLEHHFPLSLKRDAYETASWYFNRGEYQESLSWIEKINSSHHQYADALLLKAKSIGFLVEESKNPGKRKECLASAIQITDEVLSHRPDNIECLLEQVHLINRLAHYENDKRDTYRESLPLLRQVLAQNPQDLRAISEHGISFMGTGATIDGMRIYQYLEFLDPLHKDAYSLWGRANILFQYFKTVIKSLSPRNIKKLEILIKEALNLDPLNPLYAAFDRQLRIGDDTIQDSSGGEGL